MASISPASAAANHARRFTASCRSAFAVAADLFCRSDAMLIEPGDEILKKRPVVMFRNDRGVLVLRVNLW